MFQYFIHTYFCTSFENFIAGSLYLWLCH